MWMKLYELVCVVCELASVILPDTAFICSYEFMYKRNHKKTSSKTNKILIFGKAK